MLLPETEMKILPADWVSTQLSIYQNEQERWHEFIQPILQLFLLVSWFEIIEILFSESHKLKLG